MTSLRNLCPLWPLWNFPGFADDVIEGLGIPLRKEPIIVGLMPPQQADMEGRVYSLIFELLRQLDSIIICCWITHDDSHWPNLFGQELSSSSLRQGKVFGR